LYKGELAEAGSKSLSVSFFVTTLFLLLLTFLTLAILVVDALFAGVGVTFFAGTCWLFLSTASAFKLENKLEKNTNMNTTNSLENEEIEVKRMLVII
jgi:hypothetical protein